MNSPNSSLQPLFPNEILSATQEAFASTPVVDIHTHLFTPQLGELGLWGIDNLLTYHYLEAELFRSHPITPAEYWTLNVL
ncbi:MAG: hypothetical protein ABI824_11270, partial [Acidobacteriota bacterium]